MTHEIWYSFAPRLNQFFSPENQNLSQLSFLSFCQKTNRNCRKSPSWIRNFLWKMNFSQLISENMIRDSTITETKTHSTICKMMLKTDEKVNKCTVAQSLTPVDLKWSPPTSVVSWPWWCIDYISRKNEICFGALFKIFLKIVLFYYIFYHKSLWWNFLIILTADWISDDSLWFVWYVTLYTFAKEIKAYFFVTLL